MHLSDWFRTQLQSSADGLVWGVTQIPLERRMIQPPGPLGEWSAARHVFHMLYYEEYLALPSMRQWIGELLPDYDDAGEDREWARGHDLAEVTERFRLGRTAQIALLDRFAEPTWQIERETVWGLKPLRWVVTKTYQHTNEHTHDVLRLALFWEGTLKWLAEHDEA